MSRYAVTAVTAVNAVIPYPHSPAYALARPGFVIHQTQPSEGVWMEKENHCIQCIHCSARPEIVQFTEHWRQAAGLRRPEE